MSDTEGGPMSTLHDRITALADEWEREATRLRDPANPTHRRTSRSDPRRDGRPDLADVYDARATDLRAVLAETTGEYDGAAHATAVGVEVARALRGLRCGFVEPAQPVEPEPDERETLGRLLWERRGGSIRGGRSWDDPTIFTESVKESWRQEADVILAAGFRRSRPEATQGGGAS